MAATRTEYVNNVPVEYTGAGFPARIRRISWGAIIAGVAISLVTMFALNMLGLSIGAATINPVNEADPVGPGFGTGAMIWFAASTLISLFFGGFVAGHMSGLYYDNDGALHGLVTWAVVTLIGLFALTSSVGSVLSGAMSVASSAISAGAQVAGEVAPEVAQALDMQDLTWRGIQADIRNLMQNGAPSGTTMNPAGTNNTGATGSGTTDNTTGTGTTGDTSGTTPAATVEPDSTAEAGTTDTTDTTAGTTPNTTDTTAGTSSTDTGSTMSGSTASVPMTGMTGMYATDENGNPTNEIMSLNEVMFNRSLNNLLNSDNPSQADRDNVVAMLVQNTGMTQQEAEATVANWEQTYAQVRQEAEETARRVAQAAADAVTAFAGAVFAAMVVGAFAAGIGGMAGTPERHEIEIAGTTVKTP